MGKQNLDAYMESSARWIRTSLSKRRMDFTLDFNGRPLLFLDTPGHARHHYCILMKETSHFLPAIHLASLIVNLTWTEWNSYFHHHAGAVRSCRGPCIAGPHHELRSPTPS